MPAETVYVFAACTVIALLDKVFDCFALALAIREKATLVTSDHHELDLIAAADLCPLRFIR